MRPTVEMQRGFPYRRRLYAARHRRRSLWVRLAKPFVGAVLLVGSPAALAAWVMTSPEFTVRDIEVSGTRRVSVAWVQSALMNVRGAPMFEVAADEIEGQLADHPWVAAVTVRKRLPDRLHVEVLERRPAALFKRQGDLHFVDSHGEIFAPYDPLSGPADLLVLSGRPEPDALVAAIEAASRLTLLDPQWGASLSEIEVLNEMDFRLHTSALPFPLTVTVDRMEEAIAGLRSRLSWMDAHLDAVGAIDLRFERYLVIQPVKER